MRSFVSCQFISFRFISLIYLFLDLANLERMSTWNVSLWLLGGFAFLCLGPLELTLPFEFFKFIDDFRGVVEIISSWGTIHLYRVHAIYIVHEIRTSGHVRLSFEVNGFYQAP